MGRSLPLTPLRYLARGLHMWRLLQRTDPRTLIVITAPVFAPLVGWLWCALHRRQLVVDCHPGVLHFRRWRWALPIHRRLFRHARLVLVHTPDDERLVNSWGAPALFLPDDLALQSQALPMPRHTTTPSIVVAGTFDPDEPISALLAAAALVPDMELRLTGDPERLPAALRSSAPKNVTFLGYLAYDRFLGEMLAADAVAVFTTDPHVMSRAGQDAIGLGRPLVSSDRPWLRSRFAETAVLCENEPEAIARALQEALRQQVSLAQRSRERALTLRAWRDHGLEQLKLAVSPLSLPSRRGVLRTV
ncbi:MAG: glycosyltransferase family 4 protein, partial [Chloroflexi bacterium]